MSDNETMLFEWDSETGEVTGEVTASICPRSGKPLERVTARFVNADYLRMKAQLKDNECLAVKDGALTICPDYRGQKYFFRDDAGHIQQKEIKEIGQTVPENGYATFDEVPRTQAEKAAIIRSERNDKLVNEVDVQFRTALYSGQFPSEALVKYRQALLDVPQQAGFPEQVEWPEFGAE